MRLSICHSTTYRFDQPITYALQRVRLHPKDSAGQAVGSWTMDVENGSCVLDYRDHHNNLVSLVAVTPGSVEVVIACHGDVTTADNNGVTGVHNSYVPLWLFKRETPRTVVTPLIRSFCAELRQMFRNSTSEVEWMHAASGAILDRVAYTTGKTDAATTASDALLLGRGVCQDHAHVLITCARHLGLPARYVSGYLLIDDRVDQDAGHAWAEVHLSGLGWVGFDVSNGICPDDRYVRVATGLDYQDAAPVTGRVIGATDESMVVKLRVEQ